MLKYVERIAEGAAHNGEAWIAHVQASRTGRAIYFNGRCLSQISRGTYIDIESKDLFWVTGVKKRGSNRHKFGSGKINVQREAVEDLLEVRGVRSLEGQLFVIADGIETGASPAEVARFAVLQNKRLE